MTMMNTNKISFRTADDVEKLKRAEKVCAKHDELVANATSTLESAEAAYAEDPSDARMSKAKEARRTLEDAEHGRSLAQSHVSRVASEVAAAESRAIKKEIARRESNLAEVVDEEARLLAVEIAVCCVKLQQRTDARAVQRRPEIEELNVLRGRIGAAAEDVPGLRRLGGYAIIRLAELGLSAQAQLGVSARTLVDGFPAWREGFNDSGGFQEFLTGVERFSVLTRDSDGAPMHTSGTDRTPLVNEAKALLGRVTKARALLGRMAEGRGDASILAPAPVASIAAAGAAVLAIATAAATTMVGG